MPEWADFCAPALPAHQRARIVLISTRHAGAQLRHFHSIYYLFYYYTNFNKPRVQSTRREKLIPTPEQAAAAARACASWRIARRGD